MIGQTLFDQRGRAVPYRLDVGGLPVIWHDCGQWCPVPAEEWATLRALFAEAIEADNAADREGAAQCVADACRDAFERVGYLDADGELTADAFRDVRPPDPHLIRRYYGKETANA